MSKEISIEIGASIGELAKVENAIEGLFEDGKLTEVNYGNVIVASTEAALNAINHGAKNNPNLLVKFDLDISEKEITIVVEDSGLGFDHQNLPDPTDPDNIEKGSGRGIFIMKNLSDSLEFENNGAKVIMKFLLTAPVSIEA